MENNEKIFVNRKPAAILVDMDDTILGDDCHTEAAWQAACNHFAVRLGISTEALSAAIDMAREAYWKDPEQHRKGRLNLLQARREVVVLAFQNLGIDFPETARDLADYYTREKERLCSPLPGALDTLQTWREKGFRLALVTNGGSETQRRKINRFGLSRYFDCILIEGEFGAGKPEERVFLAVLERLGTEPGESWMVGDDLVRDIAGAQRTGIAGIWIDWKKAGLPGDAPVKPYRIVRSLSELNASMELQAYG